MAALNHAKIIKALQAAVDGQQPEFIYSFLKAYGFPASTISRIKIGDTSRNVARVRGDIGISQKLYFRAVRKGTSLDAAIDEISSYSVIETFKIRFILVTDFETVQAVDRKVDDRIEFDFAEFVKNYEFFLPLTGLFEKPIAYSQHPADIKACEKMGELYDNIKALNNFGKDELHDLNVFMTRLLFCFFAEDTGIFPRKNMMTDAISSNTQTDAMDLSAFFERLFSVLDTPLNDSSRKNLPASMQDFPYVDNGLFHEQITIPKLNFKSRRLLISCGRLIWAEISPVIFGAMFQTVMDQKERREFGEHFTSEENIFKVIRPLFLDDLQGEFAEIKYKKKGNARIKALREFQTKLGSLGFLDPACGSGNFLIVAFRELRELELQVLMEIRDSTDEYLLDGVISSKVTVDQFHGIELFEFPVDIARVSMMLMEHTMNQKMTQLLGKTVRSRTSQHNANIVCANALRIDWKDVVAPEKLNYIMGNPPFVGYKFQSTEQKTDLNIVASHIENSGTLDYVALWYIKSSNFIKGFNIKCAFVSTNSICQGEHISVLWKYLLLFGITIIFAYKTFKWSNESKNKAGVNCCIIGFVYGEYTSQKFIVDEFGFYRGVEYINGYLVNARNIFIDKRNTPFLKETPIATKGNAAMDNGFLLLDAEEKNSICDKYSFMEKYIKRHMSADDFLNGQINFCFWLKDFNLSELNNIPVIHERLEKVKYYRSHSNRQNTYKMANFPHLFAEIRQPKTDYIMIPVVSSERRKYIPIAFLKPTIINSYASISIPDATLYHFGILTSAMHMAWMRIVCGRLEMRYRYSTTLVYNTFPWPTVTEQQKNHIYGLAENVLLAREMHPDRTLADMYDPNIMPDDLQAAHTALDLAVDALYRKKPFESDEERLQLLFQLYEKLIGKSPAEKSESTEEMEEEDA